MSAYIDTAFALRWILATIALTVGFGLGYEKATRKTRARRRRQAEWDAHVTAAAALSETPIYEALLVDQLRADLDAWNAGAR